MEIRSEMKRNLWMGASLAALAAVLTIGPHLLRKWTVVGRQPGEFYAVHSIGTDSKGNVFTTETYRGQRVQKFHYKGLAPVTKKDQGVVWPKASKG